MELRTNAEKVAWAEQQYARSQDDLAKLVDRARDLLTRWGETQAAAILCVDLYNQLDLHAAQEMAAAEMLVAAAIQIAKTEARTS